MLALSHVIHPKIVTPYAMEPGTYGVITKWGPRKYSCPSYLGKIVFRTKDDLISADPYEAYDGGRWSIVGDSFDEPDYQITILPVGTKMELTVEE